VLAEVRAELGKAIRRVRQEVPHDHED
jgi:hypothetical protein